MMPGISAREKHHSFARAAGDTAAAHSLPAAFRRVAERYAGQVAVRDSTRSLTYAELDAASDRLAVSLLAHGVARGAYAGLLIDRSVRTPVAILGMLKAGCAYVPLDPAYPRQRLRYMADDCGLRVLVGDSTIARDCGLDDLMAIDGSAGPAQPTAPPEPAGPDDPAYVIHTSGSTGAPKGCVVSHGNVLALMRNTLPLFDVGPSDRWTLFHSASFDFSVWELWGALLTGGSAVCVPAEQAQSAEDLLALLARERVTVLNQVPSAFRALARTYAAAGAPPLALRYVVFGGESVDLDVVRDFVASAGTGAPAMVNMYGITETTVHATFKLLGEHDCRAGIASPIGAPLPHVTISLRDEASQPVDPGQPGEMYVGGAGVATGYLNRPELTAERFVMLDTPYGPRRFYRSGDLARDTGAGLEYLGRRDEQVKVRGYRIEPGEIEAVLRGHEDVRDVAVTTVRRGGGQALVACVVTARPVSREELPGRLRRYALGLLPDHMVPRQYLAVAVLPRTPSGKLDRRALRELVE
jgi:amino acid adenylation domain-containing protein